MKILLLLFLCGMGGLTLYVIFCTTLIERCIARLTTSRRKEVISTLAKTVDATKQQHVASIEKTKNLLEAELREFKPEQPTKPEAESVTQKKPRKRAPRITE